MQDRIEVAVERAERDWQDVQRILSLRADDEPRCAIRETGSGGGARRRDRAARCPTSARSALVECGPGGHLARQASRWRMTTTSLTGRDFAVVDAALRAWPDTPEAEPGLSTPAHRLIDAARAASLTPSEVGTSDLAVLLRHVLRAEAELSGVDHHLTVPRGSPWPEGSEWQGFSMSATVRDSDQLVFASPWTPAWLGVDDRDPAAAAYRGSHVERVGELPRPPADPFLTSVTGLPTYRSYGQREAIRAVLATPPTATIIGNLPTGTGKSLVAYVPALIVGCAGHDGGRRADDVAGARPGAGVPEARRGSR